ncbi:heavy-metal-associated domain-containing protein [Collinsella sp. zg1085]|uniref:heavy-metal-associated domain-containing protein n=1 Tax=Collinsella sp. zg1085 TaxID=2844380 RepID=UPI001C0D0E0D|nr:heavy metal-associated domain-containing protein [Collinsella sp. zg1085]QWT17251.1 heavy-metal-associated domain-containing protein [Collinsella sp. zg1085]
MIRYTILTEGLRCGHCEARVEAALLKLGQVQSVDANFEQQEIELISESELDETAITQAIEGAGSFGVRSISHDLLAKL